MIKITIELPDELVGEVRSFLDRISDKATVVSPKHTSVLEMAVYNLPLPNVPGKVRAENVLRNSHDFGKIQTIEQLCSTRASRFEGWTKNCGKRTIEVIEAALAAQGLRFGMTEEEIEAYRTANRVPMGADLT